MLVQGIQGVRGVSCRRGIWFKEMSQATRGALQLGTAGPLCLWEIEPRAPSDTKTH